MGGAGKKKKVKTPVNKKGSSPIWYGEESTRGLFLKKEKNQLWGKKAKKMDTGQTVDPCKEDMLRQKARREKHKEGGSG